MLVAGDDALSVTAFGGGQRRPPNNRSAGDAARWRAERSASVSDTYRLTMSSVVWPRSSLAARFRHAAFLVAGRGSETQVSQGLEKHPRHR